MSFGDHAARLGILRRGGVLLLVLLLPLLLVVLPGAAQVPSPSGAAEAEPEGVPSRERVEELIATLEDEQRRQRLIERLRLLVEAEQDAVEEPALVAAGTDLLSNVARQLEKLEETLTSVPEAFERATEAVPELADWARARIERPERIGRLTRETVLVLGGALAALLLARWALARPRRGLEAWRRRVQPPLPVSILGRILLDSLPLVAALIVGTSIVVASDSGTNLVAVTALNALLVQALVMVVIRALLSPRRPEDRLFSFSDTHARSLHNRLRRISYLIVIGFVIHVAQVPLGLGASTVDGLLVAIALVVTAGLILVVLQNRTSVAALIHVSKPAPHQPPLAGPEATATAESMPESGTTLTGRRAHPAEPPEIAGYAGMEGRHQTEEQDEDEEDGTVAMRPLTRAVEHGRQRAMRILRNILARIWHILAIIYIVAGFVIWVSDIEGGFAFLIRGTAFTALIVIAANYLNGWLEEAFDRQRERGAGSAPGEPAPRPVTGSHVAEDRVQAYLPAISLVLRIGITVTGLLAILEVWGLGGLSWLSGDTGRQAIATLVGILVVILLAVGAWEVINVLVERSLHRVDDEGNVIEPTARAMTLLPLLRTTALILLSTLAVLIVLSEIGVNIAPLLAGAGVIGLAIGFGAQTLVKDVITGLFNLMENTIAVGDVVTIAGQGGFVEGMSIRAVRLRDLSGNLYTVPFSEVTTVMNMTRDFSYYLFDIGVAYREDVDHVIEVVRQLGAELRRDRAFRREILEPIEILGVDGFADSAVIIKARIKTKPIKQWYVGREFNRRMKKRFDELGIEIPFPHLTLYFGQDKQGTAPPAHLDLTAPSLADALAGSRHAGARASRTEPWPEGSAADADKAQPDDQSEGRDGGRPDHKHDRRNRASEVAGDAPAESSLGHDR